MKDSHLFLIISSILVPLIAAILPSLIKNNNANDSQSIVQNSNNVENSNNTFKVNSDNKITQNVYVNQPSNNNESNIDLIGVIILAFFIMFLFAKYRSIVILIYSILILIIFTLFVFISKRRYSNINYKYLFIIAIFIAIIRVAFVICWNKYMIELENNLAQDFLYSVYSVFKNKQYLQFMLMILEPSYIVLTFTLLILLIRKTLIKVDSKEINNNLKMILKANIFAFFLLLFVFVYCIWLIKLFFTK